MCLRQRVIQADIMVKKVCLQAKGLHYPSSKEKIIVNLNNLYRTKDQRKKSVKNVFILQKIRSIERKILAKRVVTLYNGRRICVEQIGLVWSSYTYPFCTRAYGDYWGGNQFV